MNDDILVVPVSFQGGLFVLTLVLLEEKIDFFMKSMISFKLAKLFL